MMNATEYLKKPYGRIISPEEDGSFRAEIIEFPGCIATGNSAAEALENLEGVALSWLDVLIAKGKHVPEPIDHGGYSGKLVLRLPKSLHKKAAHMAARDGVSLNQFIVSSLSEQVGVKSTTATQPTAAVFHGQVQIVKWANTAQPTRDSFSLFGNSLQAWMISSEVSHASG